MKVETIVVGPLEENCYLLKKEGKVLVIDPGDEYEKIKKQIGNFQIEAILITHHHFDHIGALPDFSSIKVYDMSNLKETTYQMGPFRFDVLYTKGHSDDSISFLFPKEKKMFVGDFFFFRTIGRTDLPTGSKKEMQKSIEKIKQYSDYQVFPGHGPSTTLEKEKQHNSFFRLKHCNRCHILIE